MTLTYERSARPAGSTPTAMPVIGTKSTIVDAPQVSSTANWSLLIRWLPQIFSSYHQHFPLAGINPVEFDEEIQNAVIPWLPDCRKVLLQCPDIESHRETILPDIPEELDIIQKRAAPVNHWTFQPFTAQEWSSQTGKEVRKNTTTTYYYDYVLRTTMTTTTTYDNAHYVLLRTTTT